MLERDFTPGGRAAIHDRDARVIVGLAQRLDVDIPGFEPVAAAFRRLVDHGDGDLDHSALFTLLERPGVDGRDGALPGAAFDPVDCPGDGAAGGADQR
jgi:hypothetical protein